MAETTIEWTATRLLDGSVLPGYTFNPLWGCTKISPACTHCYAATWANRYGVQWGPKAERRTFGEKHWNEPRKWNAQAEKAGIRRKVFCASMADVFEEHPTWDAERPKLWALIEATPHLDWLLLTKRPENVRGMVPEAWLKPGGWPANVWLGTTAENQEWANKRVPALLAVPADIPVRFLSMEPLLGPVELSGPVWEGRKQACEALGLRSDIASELSSGHGRRKALDGLSWVICGGESGPGARPSHPDWFRALRDECAQSGVPFFFKQWGEHVPCSHATARRPFHAERTPDGDGWRVPVNPEFGGTPWGTVTQGGKWSPLTTPWNGHDDDGYGDREAVMYRVGKKAAGRLLDGRTHDAMPGGAL
jgi:protein gp37